MQIGAKKIAKQSVLIVSFVPNEDRVARRHIISEHAYVMKEEQPEPSRSLHTAQKATAIQPLTSIGSQPFKQVIFNLVSRFISTYLAAKSHMDNVISCLLKLTKPPSHHI
jgi:hypothetical protein